MNKYHDNDCFLITLYAYLRQTDLSIARGLCDKWENARNYLIKNTLIENLITKLDIYKSVDEQKYSHCFLNFHTQFIKKNQLTYNEITHIYQLLKILEELLSDELPKIYTLGKLRIDLANASLLVRKRIKNKKNRQLADRVEHYNQSEYCHYYTIEQLIAHSKIF